MTPKPKTRVFSLTKEQRFIVEVALRLYLNRDFFHQPYSRKTKALIRLFTAPPGRVVTSLRVVLDVAEHNACTCNCTGCPPNRHSSLCYVWMIRADCRAVRTLIAKLAKNPKL
jgi:hypothetical protein